ncbi:MAG TPA: SCP2 sterol-binding domain-containing protein [Anaerolineales bacterium]|jgi:hypothetical protein|nr:SCP2 sterol-binding domain-containing protein [Anaerolineales bacterium]
MPVFKDANHYYQTVGELMNRASRDPDVGPKIGKSNIVIRFIYHNPEAITTIDAKDKPEPGSFVAIIHGPNDLKADVTMTMDADVAHAFWHGKVNLMAALAKKQIIAEGPIPKILKLLPAVQPLYKQYPVLLRELGFEDMIMK